MVNNISICITLVAIFILVGIMIPFTQSAFNENVGVNNVVGITGDVGNNIDNPSIVSLGSVLISIVSMFFWTFGALPFWLDSLFLIMRFALVLVIADILIPG